MLCCSIHRTSLSGIQVISTPCRNASFQGYLKVSKKKSDYRPSSLPDGICRWFSLAEIKAATNNFSRGSFLGYDGFGLVYYRGTIDNGTTMVAIKGLRTKSDAELGILRNEERLLCQLHHPHIISLIGLCDEPEELLLVYEYMSKWSLRYHLRGENNDPIPWKQRLKICIGAARGLHYLHTGAKYAVIHSDFSTSDILLDEDWSCKLCHFGFSKLGPLSSSKASIHRQESLTTGTNGYMAPEYLMHAELTDRSDVFSFGVVLLDVLCGKRVTELWIHESTKKKTVYDFIDPDLKGRIAPECLEKYLEIACSCIQYEGNERPAMGEVEVTLELALELQNKADSEMEGSNPHGEIMYEEGAITFSIQDHLKNVYGPFLHTGFDYEDSC